MSKFEKLQESLYQKELADAQSEAYDIQRRSRKLAWRAVDMVDDGEVERRPGLFNGWYGDDKGALQQATNAELSELQPGTKVELVDYVTGPINDPGYKSRIRLTHIEGDSLNGAKNPPAADILDGDWKEV